MSMVNSKLEGRYSRLCEFVILCEVHKKTVSGEVKFGLL
jgi:hypothetical protein